MTLFDYTQAFIEAKDMYDAGCREVIDPETGEIIPFADYIASLEMGFEEKKDNLIKYCIGLKADEAAIKAEIDKLKARMDAKKKRREDLQEYLLMNIGADVKKIETPAYKVTVRTTKSAVVPESDAAVKALPVEYIRHKETWEANKAEILKALKAGEVIPGCSIKESRSISF